MCDDRKDSAEAGAKPSPNTSATPSQLKLDAALFTVVTLVLFTILCLLIWSLQFQSNTYKTGIQTALQETTLGHHTIALAYARAFDFAVAKTSVIFIGMLLVFVGSLFVLKVVNAGYTLGLESSEKGKATFTTSSPGLVMITLGIVTVNIAMFSKSFVNVDTGTGSLTGEKLEVYTTGEKIAGALVKISFPKGITTLSEQQKEQLKPVRQLLQQQPNMKVHIDAHGDPGEPEEMNLALRERRGLSIREWLSGTNSPGERITLSSYGEDPPDEESKTQAVSTIRLLP
jgi:OmpA family